MAKFAPIRLRSYRGADPVLQKCPWFQRLAGSCLLRHRRPVLTSRQRNLGSLGSAIIQRLGRDICAPLFFVRFFLAHFAALLLGAPVFAQSLDHPDADPNAYPDPYTQVNNFLKLPAGRVMGSTIAVAVDHQGHIWVADRCGANDCKGSKLDPIMEFDANGNFIKAFGAGKFLFPHGIYHRQGRSHLAHRRPCRQRHRRRYSGIRPGRQIVAHLGDARVSRAMANTLSTSPMRCWCRPARRHLRHRRPHARRRQCPHHPFRQERQIREWSGAATASAWAGWKCPMRWRWTSKGRLYIADRYNNRIQIFSQDGQLLDIWSQFGRPSGIYIDENDILYSTDSESRTPVEYGFHPGWARGIRIGSVKDGIVRALIPDIDPGSRSPYHQRRRRHLGPRWRGLQRPGAPAGGGEIPVPRRPRFSGRQCGVCCRERRGLGAAFFRSARPCIML